MKLKYLFSFLTLYFLFSCTSVQNIVVENQAFNEFKNTADYKDCTGASKEFEKFTLINNQWGASKVKNGNYHQCVYHKNGTFGWEWSSPSRSYGVIGYPELWMGTTAWGLKNEIKKPNYFKKLADLKKLKAVYDTEISANDKKYNLAFDIWLHSERIVAKENIAVELMIWEDYQKFKPFGKNLGNFFTRFGEYELWKGQMSKPEINADWTYIALVRKEKRRIGEVDLKEILDELISKRHIAENLYISSIEFGTEILNSSGNILVRKYDVEIE